MLRQIYIFHKGSQILLHSFAIGLDVKEFENVKKAIQSYIDMPMPGKTFNRPMSNFQIFHRGFGMTYFLFVTDLVDTIDYIDGIVKNILNKFKELFPNAEEITKETPEKNKFLNYLYEMQQSLHSKITILGPIGSGKSTLYDLIKSGQEKQIMNFAKSAPCKIDNLSFDIWDFQLKDNFSLLWSKFVQGSDMAIILLDASNYNLKVVDHFLKLQKNEGRFSRILLIANKFDLVSEDSLKKIKNEFNSPNLKEFSCKSPNAKETLIDYIREALQLKKSLPPNFPDLVKEAESLNASNEFTNAIGKYKKLIQICNKYQEFGYIDTFNKKIAILEQKREEESELQKEAERKKKFEKPDQIKFKDQISVKSLPAVKTLPISAPKLKPIATPVAVPTPKPIPKLYAKEHQKSSDAPVKNQDATSPTKISPLDTDIPEDIINQKDFNYAESLQKIIIQMGGSLSMELCNNYITELLDVLNRSLNIQDLKLAAQVFVMKENEG